MAEKRPLQAVVFDLGGVVLGSPLEGIADFEKENNIPPGFVNINIVSRGENGAFQRLERGEITSMSEFYKLFKQELDDPAQLQIFADYRKVDRASLPAKLDIDAVALFTTMLERSMRADPDFVHAIYMLRGSKLKVGALTNNFAPMGSSAPGSINLHALEDLFDEIVESAVEKVRKPDPKAFQLICERLKVDPRDAAMLDDIGLNLKGAKSVGMETILVKLKNKRQALLDLERIIFDRNGLKVSLVPSLGPVKLSWDVSGPTGKPGPRYIVGDAYGRGCDPVVILFHGGGQTRHAWGGTCRKLAAEGFFAVAVDMKGHGESYWDPEQKYHAPDFSKDVDGLVKQMGMANRAPLLVGASLGGLAVLGSESSHDEKAGGVCLVDVTPKLEQNGVERVLSFMSNGMRNGFDSLEDVAEAIRQYQPHRQREKKDNNSLDSLKKNLVFDEKRKKWVFHWDPSFVDAWEPNTTEASLQQYERDNLSAAAKIKCPVMLLKGKFTDIVSDEGVTSFKQAIPHAIVRTVKNAGHMIAGDQNDIFSAELVGFASSIRASMDKSSLALLEKESSNSSKL